MIKKIINSGFFYIFFAEIANKIIIFLSGIVLVRIIPKSEYGSYAYSQNIYNFFMIMSGMGMTSGLLQICCEREKKYAWSYYKKGSKYALIFNLFLSFLIGSTSFFIALPIKNTIVYLRLFALIPVVSIGVELIQIYNRYTLQNQKYSYLSIINTFFVFFLGVLGALKFQVTGLIVFQGIGYILTIIYAAIIQRFPIKDIIGKVEDKLQDWGVLLKISFVSMLNNSASIILYNLDIFVLGYAMSKESVVASYKVATYIPNALSFIPTALIIYVYPYFARNSDNVKWVLKHYIKLVVGFSLFNLLIVVTLLLMAPYIVCVFFGEQYLDSLSVFKILTVSYFFNASFRNTTGNILASQRRYKTNLFIGIFAGVINVLGDFIFIPLLGSEGAAITTLSVTIVASVTMVISLMYILKKKSIDEID